MQQSDGQLITEKEFVRLTPISVTKSDRVERLFRNDVVVDNVDDNAIEILHAAVAVDDLRLHDSRWLHGIESELLWQGLWW